METPHLWLKIYFIFLMITVTITVDGSSSSSGGGLNVHMSAAPRMLLVFGDSYADTGNLPKIISPSWSYPYGITFPGKPAGRFSDGRILTDYIARFVGIRSPIPYKFRRYGQKLVLFGMNFAVGGSGVFNTTGFFNASLSVQIDNLKQLVEEGTYSLHDLRRSIALVVISGNDYAQYRNSGGTMQGLKTFTPQVIRQLKHDVKRLIGIGVGKVAVTNLHPIGCLPSVTSYQSSYSHCNASLNLAASYHNRLLKRAVFELNTNTTTTTTTRSIAVVIDLYNAFMSTLKNNQSIRMQQLKPCCEAVSSEYSCGYVDINGVNKYRLCSTPDTTFYWDSSHPTQAAWNAAYSLLKPSLRILLTF